MQQGARARIKEAADYLEASVRMRARCAYRVGEGSEWPDREKCQAIQEYTGTEYNCTGISYISARIRDEADSGVLCARFAFRL